MNLKLLVLTIAASLIFGCANSLWHKPASALTPATAAETAKTEVNDNNTVSVQTPAAENKKTIVADRQIDAQNIKRHDITKSSAKQPETKTSAAEEQQNKREDFVFTSDGRLMHPWYGEKEIKNYEGAKPAWFDESLKFKIGWSFITAGEAELTANKIFDVDGQPVFAVEAYAQSYSVIDKLFKVRDINISWISADLTKSLGYWQSVREGRYKRDEWLIFDYKNSLYSIYKQNNKKELSKELIKFNGDRVWDMLSSLYFVRSQELPLNETIYFDIVNVKKQYPLKVTVHGKETIKTKAGKFDCIVVEPAISGEGIFVSKGKSLKVWLTDDKYRMPVKMSVEVFIGSVHAELVSFERK
ncbi:MAG: DUF3108 domain-containing protein [Elusimicrobiota bacterium]|jgi:hypothetical protein|nr:DUF3108 domain-containing protein [Elusimicrobiota bacterium]